MTSSIRSDRTGDVGPPFRLSVIIPTHGRPERLAACLDSLGAQAEPTGGWEVIVIDDGSDPPLSEGSSAATGAARFVWQPSAGLNAARNRGIAEARGDIIAFLDDDTVVDPSWARAVVATFAETGCDGLGGRVRLDFEAAPPRWLTAKLRRYLAEYDLGDAPRAIVAGPVPVGANCAVTRAAATRLEGFSAGLDRHGNSLLSNGDTDFFRRLLASGGRVRYAPGAQVAHQVPADRLTAEFFRRRAHAQGLSDAVLDHRAGHTKSAAREWLRAGRAVPIACRALLTGNGLLRGRIWCAYCAGRRTALAGGGDENR